VFAVAVLASLSISVREAWALIALFSAQFLLAAVLPPSLHGTELVFVSGVYVALGAAIMLRDRGRLPGLLRDGLWTPYDELLR
jgi:cation:H+ antiporter